MKGKLINMDKERKKEIVTEYKEKKTSGGVYKITNNQSGKSLIKAEVDLQSFKNRFEFSKKIGSLLNPKLSKDFQDFGADSFELEFLEEVDMKNDETLPLFKKRLKSLEEKWIEKFGSENIY